MYQETNKGVVNMAKDYMDVMLETGLTRKGQIINYNYDYIRLVMGNEWTDYDCKIIESKINKYTLNREVQYLMNRHRLNFREAIERLVDSGLLKMWYEN